MFPKSHRLVHPYIVQEAAGNSEVRNQGRWIIEPQLTTQSCRNGFLIAACEPKPGFSNRTATKRPLASSPDTSGMMLDDRVLLPFLVGKYVYWSEIAVRKWHERLFAAQESWEMH